MPLFDQIIPACPGNGLSARWPRLTSFLHVFRTKIVVILGLNCRVVNAKEFAIRVANAEGMTDVIHEPMSHPVGRAPLFRQRGDDIQFVTRINDMVRWDPGQSRVSLGERLLVLVLDVLSGTTPLYRVHERLIPTDLEILVGAGRRPEDFTDDSLRCALDKLVRAEPAKVFSTLAMAAFTTETISLRTGHWDSTSPSVFRDYAVPTDGVRPAYGHFNDHRPDLQQLLMTLLFNQEVVPLFGTVASGNTSNKTLNGEMIDRLVAALSPTPLQDLL